MRLKSFSILFWIVIGLTLVGIMPFAISLYQISSNRDDIVIQTQQTHLVTVKAIANSISAYIAMLLTIAEAAARNPNLYKDPGSESAQEILTGILLSKQELVMAAIYSRNSNGYQLIQRAKRMDLDDVLSENVHKHVNQSVSIIETESGQWLNVTIQIVNLNLIVQMISQFEPINLLLTPMELGSALDIAVVNRDSYQTVAGKRFSLDHFPAKIIKQALANRMGAGAERYEIDKDIISVSAFANISNSPWFVLSKQPAHIAELATTRMWESAVQIFIIIIVLSILFTLAAYIKIVRPLRKLIVAYQSLCGEGPEHQSGSEIEQLQQSFEKLQHNINSGSSLKKISLDRYEVIDVIGVGNMGTVLRAWDPTLERHVALKTVRLDTNHAIDSTNSLKEHLMQEAITAAKLTHPNIVTVYDVVSAGHFAFIAMEYIDGVSLHEYLSEVNYLSIEEFASLACATLKGLTYAHTEGVIHRDIKPANILISKVGDIKITDFGVASFIADIQTENNLLKGTPPYFAPEIWLSGHFSEYSDLFALGVVFYRCLTGRMPFQLYQIPPPDVLKDLDTIIPPRLLRTDIPTIISDRVMQLLATNIDERQDLVDIMLGELQQYIGDKNYWPNQSTLQTIGLNENENDTQLFTNSTTVDTTILFHRD